jgi:uncharacterized protein
MRFFSGSGTSLDAADLASGGATPKAAEKIMATENSNRGFASMDEDKQREIARKGGESVPAEKRSFSQDHELASEAGGKGGNESGGNFANDPQRASEAGRKGGEDSGGNFANDHEKASEAGRKGGEASRAHK